MQLINTFCSIAANAGSFEKFKRNMIWARKAYRNAGITFDRLSPQLDPGVRDDLLSAVAQARAKLHHLDEISPFIWSAEIEKAVR